MAESILKLNGPDDNIIYGKLREVGARRLILHLHGMTHHAGCLLEVTGSEFFAQQGFDHYRITLYDWMRDSRRLTGSTLTTHQRDIQAVLDHFKPLYDEIFITAHSLGGLATLIMNPQDVKAISLWDPSFDVTNFWNVTKSLSHMPERRQYQLDYGNVFVIGEELVEEIKNYPDERCLELAKKITTPTQMIIPEQSIFLASPHTSPDNYTNAFAGPFDLRRIQGANHTFSNDGDRHKLFEATLDWLTTHSALG